MSDSEMPESSFSQRLVNVTMSAQKFAEDFGQAAKAGVHQLDLKGRIRRHPYGMVGLTMGAGYVLGGGLFSGLTLRALKMGWRLGAIPLVSDEALRLLDSWLSERNKKGSTAPLEPREHVK